MKKIIEVTNNQLCMEDLLGKNITVFCGNYFYTGELVIVNSEYIALKNPKIVYETGELTSKKWGDAQKLPHEWYVMKHAIESYGILDKE